MTEEEAREIVVTPEMVRAGYGAFVDATKWCGRDGIDEHEGLAAAFPAMLRVWRAQVAGGCSAPAHS